MGYDLLHVSRHVIDDDDKQAILRALDSGIIARGGEARAFEDEFAEYVGAKYAVSCSSGTAALHMAALALRLGVWDEIEVPTMTFCATANAMLMTGAKAIYYDNMDPDMSGDKGVVIHFAGSAFHARDAKIEDACHALGALYKDRRRIGSCPESNMTCFSFHPAKHITTGEGGMVTTNDEELATRLRSVRNNGRELSPMDSPWGYKWTGPGLNYHMSEVSAALGRSQLRKALTWKIARRELARVYWSNLPENVSPILQSANQNEDAFHIFPVRIDFEAVGHSRHQVMIALLLRGIETQVHYKPLHLHPAAFSGGEELCFPHAEAYYKQTLTLPLHVGMTYKDVVHVCDALKKIVCK